MDKHQSIKILSVIALFLATSFASKAQLTQSFFLNGTLPTNEFNNSIYISEEDLPMGREHIGKGATVGLGFTYRAGYRFDIGFGEVTPFAEVSLFWNRIKSDSRDIYDKQRCTDPHYFNIPISAGVNYRYMLTDMVTIYGEFGLGYDILSITREGWKGGSDDPTKNFDYRYNSGNALCWQLGAGVFLGNYVSVGITYNGLGKHLIDYNTSKSIGVGSNPNEETVHRRLGLLALRIGFHL